MLLNRYREQRQARAEARRNKRAQLRRDLFRLGEAAGRNAWAWARSQPVVQRQLNKVEARIDHIKSQARSRLASFEEEFWEWVRHLENERPFEVPHRAGPTLTECYQLLEVRATDSNETIRRAWRAQMLTCHPDRFAQDEAAQDRAERKAREVNEAYQTICRARGV